MECFRHSCSAVLNRCFCSLFLDKVTQRSDRDKSEPGGSSSRASSRQSRQSRRTSERLEKLARSASEQESGPSRSRASSRHSRASSRRRSCQEKAQVRLGSTLNYPQGSQPSLSVVSRLIGFEMQKFFDQRREMKRREARTNLNLSTSSLNLSGEGSQLSTPGKGGRGHRIFGSSSTGKGKKDKKGKDTTESPPEPTEHPQVWPRNYYEMQTGQLIDVSVYPLRCFGPLTLLPLK